MDRFLDEQENPAPMIRDRSSSPSINSLIYGDPKRHAHNELKAAAVVPEDLAVALDIMQTVIDPNTLAFPPKVTPSCGNGSESAVPVLPTPRSKRLHPHPESTEVPVGSFHPIASSEQTMIDSTASVSPTSTTKPLVSIAETCLVTKSDDNTLSEPCAKRAKLSADGICVSVSMTSCGSAVSQTTRCHSPAATVAESISSSMLPTTRLPITFTSTTATAKTPVTVSSLTKLQDTLSATVTPMHSINGGDHIGSVALSNANVGSTNTAIKLINDVSISSIPSKSASSTTQAMPAAKSLVQ